MGGTNSLRHRNLGKRKICGKGKFVDKGICGKGDLREREIMEKGICGNYRKGKFVENYGKGKFMEKRIYGKGNLWKR